MRASAGFGFFLLFLAGFALVTLKVMRDKSANAVPTAADLSASAWRPSHIGEMAVDDDTAMFVQFEADGRITGHGGCNNFFSRYQLEDNKIHVEPIGISRKACEPPAVMSIELSFVQALQLATTVAGVDNRMAMRNDLGHATVRFDAIDRRDPQ
jgi:heat shock protein HslJ